MSQNQNEISSRFFQAKNVLLNCHPADRRGGQVCPGGGRQEGEGGVQEDVAARAHDGVRPVPLQPLGDVEGKADGRQRRRHGVLRVRAWRGRYVHCWASHHLLGFDDDIIDEDLGSSPGWWAAT